MPQLLLNVPQRLSDEVLPLARETNETPEELAVRLLEEYVEDCRDADRITAEIDAGTMRTHNWQEARLGFGLES